MRLSDAGLRQRPTKLIYTDHRLPPCVTEDAPRDRSNRLLGQYARLPRLEFFPKHPAQRRFVHRRGAYGLAQRLID
jgi:hypothetical protein